MLIDPLRLLSVIAALAAPTFAIGSVSRAGRYLYNEDGSRFYIKGIAYQEQGVSSSCLYSLLALIQLMSTRCRHRRFGTILRTQYLH